VSARGASDDEQREFHDPPWSAPFDVQREIERIPQEAQIRGMFIIPLVQETKRANANLAKRERYVGFQFYPLREHAQLLVDACAVLYPKLSMRLALRKLGRAAPKAFVGSTLGRVVLQSAQGVYECVSALAKGYELSTTPGRATVEEVGHRVLDVTLEHVYHFVDCHHIGAFEGVVKQAGERCHIKLRQVSPSVTVLRLTW
jgi:uncharacterized protein (TIGR02265 family)